jgi:hypothetical protein
MDPKDPPEQSFQKEGPVTCSVMVTWALSGNMNSLHLPTKAPSSDSGVELVIQVFTSPLVLPSANPSVAQAS